MKNILSLLLPFAILISGCSQEELKNGKLDLQDGRIFTASFEQDQTRTYVEDGYLRWTAGDQISLFDGNTLNRQYKFDGETGDNSGTFSIVNAPYGSGNDLTANYAVYPYASSTKIAESGAMTVTLPSEQAYAENSFGPGANTMVAVTKDKADTFLKFKNVCGYLKLQLYGDEVTVKSITLTGNNNEKIAGEATITPSYSGDPTTSTAEDATGTITLNCEEGVKIGTTLETATAFWIVVPPITFDDGFKVTITDINGVAFTKSTSNIIVVERNIIKPMTAFEVEIEETESGEETIPNNQIWYTSSDGNIIAPKKTSDFGANIISNVYENGKGIITFDGDITVIGVSAFTSCAGLTSIIIPETVTIIKQAAFQQCFSLKEIKLPNSVTSIESLAFETSGLRNITIPNSVTSIGSNAFTGSALSSIYIPASVTSIELSAFAGCRALTSITIDENNLTYDSRNNCNGIIQTSTNTLLLGCLNTVIPASVTKIGIAAFNGCSLLTNITIPENVTSIEPYSFVGCTSLSVVDVKATEPPALIENPFKNCSSNLTIYVPKESYNKYTTVSLWKDLNITTINQ